MQEKSPALHHLNYGALAANVLLVSFLAWHLAFEAVPEAIVAFNTSLSLGGRTLALAVMVPYALVVGYLAVNPRKRMVEWKTAAAVIASIAGYIACVIAMGWYVVSLSMPD